MPKDTGIGASSKRREDIRFLTGVGNYTDDLSLHAQSHAVMVRSPHAHAEIKGIAASAALAMTGVLAVLTGADWAADGLGNIGGANPQNRRVENRLPGADANPYLAIAASLFATAQAQDAAPAAKDDIAAVPASAIPRLMKVVAMGWAFVLPFAILITDVDALEPDALSGMQGIEVIFLKEVLNVY